MYRIGEFARLSQVPVKTLRYYDEIGLLRPLRGPRGGGYRIYYAEHFERLNRILVLKDSGLSLGQIRAVLDDHAGPAELADMLRQRRDAIALVLRTESARLARIDARLALIADGALPVASEIAVRRTDAWLVASIRRTIARHEDCEALFDELDHHVGRGVGRSVGAGSERRRGAIWHACAEGVVDCEAFAILPAPVEATPRIRVHVLPPRRVVSLFYRGDAEYLPAYRAIRAWLAASGLETVGPKSELFLADGQRDGGESATEIHFPIRAERRSGRAAAASFA
jgi:DNA-binding transcriptional MerR regulator